MILTARLDMRKIRTASIEAMQEAGRLPKSAFAVPYQCLILCVWPPGVDEDEAGSATDILLETVTKMTRSQLRMAQRCLTEEEGEEMLRSRL
eukprot:199853-Rhodomonas_salina.3